MQLQHRMELHLCYNAIHTMLGKVPNIRLAEEYHDSIHSKLVSYEDEYLQLKEAAHLLELALLKSNILNQDDRVGDDSAAEKWQYLVHCGSTVVIPNVLPYLICD